MSASLHFRMMDSLQPMHCEKEIALKEEKNTIMFFSVLIVGLQSFSVSLWLRSAMRAVVLGSGSSELDQVFIFRCCTFANVAVEHTKIM